MRDEILRIEHVSKRYRLGMIGGTTLRDELQRKRAKRKGLADPTRLVTDSTAEKTGEEFWALNDINFSVMRGDRVGIIGHNGAGKSTLLKLISRITAPSSGNIEMNGRVASMLEVGTGFHPELTGRENIYMNGAILGMSRSEIDSKIDDIIDFSECRKFIDTPVKRYSSGMYVKLAFSVAAHLDSEIMIMDEVLAVGDMAFQKKCLEKMSDVSQKEGRTILYVSHNMNTIRQLCERCIVLDHGSIIYDGTVEKAIEIYSKVMAVSDKEIPLADLKRNQDEISGDIHMDLARIINADTWRIDVENRLQFSIEANCLNTLTNVGFRSRLCSSDDTVITVYLAPKILDCKAGQHIEISFDVDTSMLIPGLYKLNLAFYGMNEYGGEQFYDRLENAVIFEVKNVPGFNDNKPWDRFSWGIVKLPEMKVIEIK